MMFKGICLVKHYMSYFNLEETHEYKNIGLPAEIKAREIIKKVMNVEIKEVCNNADYDFKDSNNITYEVKADRLSIKTDNFFMEYGQKTPVDIKLKPSGISKSKADYHMLMYGESFYKIKTEDIRYLIVLNDYRKTHYIHTDKTEERQGVLLPVNDIEPYAIIYNFAEWCE